MSEAAHNPESESPPADAAPAAAPPAPPRRRLWLRLPLAIFLQLLLPPLSILVWVLATQSGLRFALGLVEDLAPERFQVHQVDGRILGDLHLEGIRLRLPDLSVDLGSFDLRWTPFTALGGTLRIQELAARDLNLVLTPTMKKGDSPMALPAIALPLRLELQRGLVERLSIQGPGGAVPFRVDRIALAATWAGRVLEIGELALALPEPSLTAGARGKVELIGDYPLDIDLAWNLTQAPAATLDGMGTIGGDLKRLTLEIDQTGSAEVRLAAVVQAVLDAPRWEGTLEIARVDLPAFRADLPAVDIEGRLATSGDLTEARVQGNLTGAAPARPGFGRLNANLDLTWRDRVLDIATLEIAEDKPGARLTAGGTLDLREPAGRFDLKATWEKLRWPLTGDPLAESPQGQAGAAGSFEDFRYEMKAQAWGRDFPAAAIELKGEGDRQASRIEGLKVGTLGGEVLTRGKVAWAPEPSWDLLVTATDIDPGKQWPEWAGSLEGRIASRGGLTASGPDLTAAIESLQGKLRGYPVEAAGKLQIKGKEIAIEQLAISSGLTHLRAEGTVGETLGLKFDLSSPDLKNLLPDAAGSIKANGTISGTTQAPAVKLELAARGVRIEDQGIQRLDGTADLDLGKDGRLNLGLTGERLAAGGLLFDSLRVEGEGDLGSHRLTAQVTGKPLALDLRAEGGLKGDDAYAGKVTQLEVRSQKYGNWRLQKAAEVRIAGVQIDAGPVCVREGAGSGGCVRFDRRQAGSWDAQLDLDRLAFALLKPFIPKDMILNGEAKAKASFKAAGGMLSGNASLEVPRGVLSANQGKRPQLLNFSAARLGLEANGKGLSAKLDLPMAKLGELHGEFALAGWRLDDPKRPDQALRGRVRARIANLGLVSDLVPDIANVRGNIDLDLGLSGTIGRPGISGHARLANGGLDIPLMGLKVTDLALNAEAAGPQRIDYRGGFAIGDGRLEIGGQSLAEPTGWRTELRVTGDKIKVVDSKEYFALVSPDIRFEMGPAGAAVTGEVTVPEARIRPRAIPEGTVTPSQDVVLVPAPAGKGGLPLRIDLRLILGNDVSIDAFGLRGLLRGDLRVLQEPGKELFGDGQMSVVDGSYRLSGGLGLVAVIGKPLTVEQGFLSYARSPLSNPFIMLIAKREGGDMTAGVRVVGTLKKPKMTFFSDSDPGLTQAEVTNYLITGVPPKRGGESDEHALAVGTYVAPKLYVEYENALGDEADKVKLRYEHNNWIEFQTETGEGQGGDIFFKFER